MHILDQVRKRVNHICGEINLWTYFLDSRVMLFFFLKISIVIPGMYFEDIVQRNNFEGILELAPFTYESVIIYSLNIFR